MFGHRNDNDENTHQADDHPVTDQPTDQIDDQQVEVPAPDHNDAVVGSDDAWQHPGAPLDDHQGQTPETTEHAESKPEPISDVVSPSGPAPTAPAYHAPAPVSDEPKHDDEILSANDPELIEIRQKALGELSPLMEHLDQAPEEKFRTTMMMIQSNDDQTLIKTAYEAAKQITDDKVRAQALLDIVNEINYFTQHPDN